MPNILIPTPRIVELAITGRCNLHCQYCFYADEMTARTDLTTAQWLAFFDQLGKLGVMEVCLTGGEAFTRRDLFELIDGVVANRMRYELLTNGTLIDDKVIAQFDQGKRRVRMEYIQVSIDGSRAEIHDLSRPNSFYRSVRGLRMLKEAGFPVTVRVTINRHNLNDLENIAEFLLEDIGLPAFTSNSASPIGAGCRNAADVSLNAVEMAQAMRTIGILMERYPGRLHAMAGPQANIQMHAEMEQARATGVKSQRWEMGYLTACGCIYSQISVMHDGSIVPCHLLPGLVMGNILTDPLEEIWLNHPILTEQRQRRDIPMQEVPGCEVCEWANYCNGGCPGLAHQLTGSFISANPVDCYRKFLSEIPQGSEHNDSK
jgi:SynChlorMet cassette radical SAM/SPASM protein ScmE